MIRSIAFQSIGALMALHIGAAADGAPRNPWPEEWEREFQQRARIAIKAQARPSGYGTTHFESEKRSYGRAMLAVLGGYEREGLKYLQQDDAQAGTWNKHTLGIDFFPSFTLKHQVRKYFHFGPQLDPAYRVRMKEAARLWTEQDPLGRPHPAYQGPAQREDWTPHAKNSWVDVRSTDNLKLMRETSAFLFAEETGNGATRALYKQRLTDWIVALYHAGMSEWESENYLGHGLAPLLNLHDFARDEEMRLLAKAALDYLATAGALKYWRGNYGGPSRRDYNHPFPFGGSAAVGLWLWFGDSPGTPENWETDEAHTITSPYRPPAAMVALARRDFTRPAELRNCKGGWEVWKNWRAARPAFRETIYYGRHFQLGTLTQGTCWPDVNGFKALVASERQGSAQIFAAPCSDPRLLGSPKYTPHVLAGPSAVGQSGNLAIYLTAEAPQPYLWIVPAEARVEQRGGATFVRSERCTVAIWPLNASPPEPDEKLTVQLASATNVVLRSTRAGEGCYGFAVEFGEVLAADQFIARAERIAPTLNAFTAEMTGVEGRVVRVQWAKEVAEIRIWREGVERRSDTPEENRLFGSFGDEAQSPVSLGWQAGELRVRAGGRAFRCAVSSEGKVDFGPGEQP